MGNPIAKNIPRALQKYNLWRVPIEKVAKSVMENAAA